MGIFMLASFEAVFGTENGLRLVILIIAALALGLYLKLSSRNKVKSRADKLQDMYRVMDSQKLMETPDSELIDAVISNIMAGLDPRNPDAYRKVPLLSRGRCAVYSVWLTCYELRDNSISDYLNSPSGRFAELAADGFELIGAERCSSLLKSAYTSDEPIEIEAAGSQLAEAVEQENPLELCRQYIRANPEEFTD
ncbi:MAG: hypothetical protein PHH84_03120 [Oscillospiraceae bacterium]|nr:hypothetical protein [Oscillospiraceae bacterium]MDD4413201.1 hypothetical protein [Oscillospiraceae bacterium]